MKCEICLHEYNDEFINDGICIDCRMDFLNQVLVGLRNL